jgi:hypothetical protein
LFCGGWCSRQKGFYYNFVSDTIQAKDAGMEYTTRNHLLVSSGQFNLQCVCDVNSMMVIKLVRYIKTSLFSKGDPKR